MLLSSNELDMLILQHGKDGTSADSKYIWVKYAQDENGTDLTDNPTNAVYIGIAYNKTEKHESDNPNDYTWTRIKGNDGESAYTVILQNENITFSVSNQNNIALMDQSFDTSVVVFKGTDAVSNFTIGTVESKNGISVIQKNNTITFSVEAGNKIEADYGKFSIPISVNGLVFKKEVSWSLAKAGAVGDQGNPGEPALSISLGNESQNIPCTYDGHVINDMLIEISFVGYRGLTRTPCNVAVGTLPSGMTLGSTENCTISNDGSIILNIVKNATLGTESTLTGNIVLTFSINGKTLVKNFTWAKSKDGGLSYIYSIEPSSYVINKTYDGTLSPASITFNAYYQKDGSDRIPYHGLFTIEESTTGSDFKSTYLSSKNESSLTYTPTSNNIKSVRCTLSQTDKVSVVLDRQTVIVLSDDKMKDALTTVTTRVNGVSSKVDGIDKKITNKVWQTDITTAVNNYDGTTVKSLRDQVSSQETKIGEITSEVSDVKTTVKNNQASVQKDIASIKQDATGFKQTVASTYETKNDATSKYSSFDQRAGKIETNVKTLQGNVTTLSQTDTEIKAELKTAKGDITTLKSDASGLSAKITNAQGDVNTLKADAKTMKSDISDAKGNINTMKSDATTMKTRISNAEGDISTLQQTANGFQVQLSKKADQVDSFNWNLVPNSYKMNNQWSAEGGFVGTTTVVLDPDALCGYHIEVKCTTAGSGPHYPVFSKTSDKVGKTYTWSFWAKCSANKSSVLVGHECGGTKRIDLTTSWQKYFMTWKYIDAAYSSFVFYATFAVGEILYIRDFKIEEGSIATKWAPAESDLKGDKGDKGETGASGKGVKSTAVTYQASSSGTTIPTGVWSATPPATSADKPYFWTRTIITYTDNTTSTAYNVGSTPEGIVVGGRNLATNTNKGTTGWSWSMQTGGYSKESVSETGVNTCKLTRDSVKQSGWSVIQFSYIGRTKWEADTNYTVSVDVKASVSTSMNPGFRHGDSSNMLIQSCKAVNNKTVANVWTKLVWVVKSAATLPSGTSQNTYFTGMNSNVGVSYQFKNLKIEKGNTATDWTPAPEDYVSFVDVEYYLSTSPTSLSGGSWSTTAPTWVNGKYMWSRTVTTDGAGNRTYSPNQNGVCIAGAQGATGAKGDKGDTGGTGATGKGVKSIVEQYYKSTSATAMSGGSWSTTYPGWENSKYIWTRSVITYTDNTTSTTTAVCVTGSKGDTGATGAKGDKGDKGEADIKCYKLLGGSNQLVWSKLGTLISAGNNSNFIINIYTGSGYNGQAQQNSQAEIVIKDGWQASASTTSAFGVSVTRQNCDDLKVQVRATASNKCDVWVYLPWAYSWGTYTIAGKYTSWETSSTTQTTEPITGTLQDLAYRMNSENAAKTATNFMEFTSGNGLQIGNKTDGSWSGYRTKISASAFEIINQAGITLAYYGDKLIQLGKNTKDSVIELCGGLGKIQSKQYSGYQACEMSSDYVALRSTHQAVLTSSTSIGNCMVSAAENTFGATATTTDSTGRTTKQGDIDISDGVVEFSSIRNGYDCTVGVYAGGWSGGTYRGSFSPSKGYTEKVLLGDNGAGQLWDRLMAKNATQIMSDRKAKYDIKPLGADTESQIATMSLDSEHSNANPVDIHSELFDRLQPVQYKMVNDDQRIRFGFVAQDVVDAMKELGIREDELDLVHHDQRVTENGYNDTYGMVYTNLIALITHELQLEKQRRSNLELEVADLRSELETMRDNLSGNTN